MPKSENPLNTPEIRCIEDFWGLIKDDWEAENLDQLRTRILYCLKWSRMRTEFRREYSTKNRHDLKIWSFREEMVFFSDFLDLCSSPVDFAQIITPFQSIALFRNKISWSLLVRAATELTKCFGENIFFRYFLGV